MGEDADRRARMALSCVVEPGDLRLRDRFELVFCDIVPGERREETSLAGIAISAAERIESYLSSKAPAVLALGTGRTLRAAVQAKATDRKSVV